jgi:3-isopropylmalate/(R)-2-methylmalate dehydratase large subunit
MFMATRMTLAQKILAKKSGRPFVQPGEIVWAEPDIAMMHEALGPIIIAQDLKRLGNKIRYPERIVLVSDHNSPPSSAAQADLLAFTRRWAKEYKLPHFYEYEGICHQLLVEKGHVRPGRLVVGTDSHTVMGGALGALSAGIGSTEMLGVLVSGSMWFRVPETVKIEWVGRFPDGIMAKDLILRIIGDFGSSLTYRAIEYGGSALRDMSVDQRFCLSNMTAEAGGKAGMMEPDEKTLAYLKQVISAEEFEEIEIVRADENAPYEKVFTYQAEEMVPVVAAPHHPENTYPVSDVAGQKIDQAYIGSCAGGRYSDLEAAARILKGRKVAKGTRLIVCPASQTVYKEAMKAGIIETLYEAGAIVTAPGCGACAGEGVGVVGAGEVCISATNRNFKGRMGSPDAHVYLASPLSVAAAAVAGEIIDPRTFL